MIEFSRDTWGHPWHGKYNSATGKIESRWGTQIDTPGVPPSGYIQGVNTMDAYAIKIPGYPEAVTTPDDQAAGREWLNYAIMSGGNHRLYGQDIGANRWIYIDPASKPWLVEMAHVAVQLNLTFKRFGIFCEGEDAPITVTTPIDLKARGSFTMFLEIDDIDSRGAQVALVSCFYDEAWGASILHSRFPRAFYLLSISGSAGMFSVTLEPKEAWPGVSADYFNSAYEDTTVGTYTKWAYYDYGNDWEIVGPIEGPTNNLLDPSDWPAPTLPNALSDWIYASCVKSGVQRRYSEWAIGATLIDDEWGWVVLSIDRNVNLSQTADPSTLATTGKLTITSRDDSLEGSYGISIGGNKQVFDLNVVLSVDGSTSTSIINGLTSANAPSASTTPGDLGSWMTDAIPSYCGHLIVAWRRLSNRCYALAALNINALSNPTMQHMHIGFAGPHAKTAAQLTPNVTFGTASAHPVTGEMISSINNTVCWV